MTHSISSSISNSEKNTLLSSPGTILISVVDLNNDGAQNASPIAHQSQVDDELDSLGSRTSNSTPSPRFQLPSRMESEIYTVFTDIQPNTTLAIEAPSSSPSSSSVRSSLLMQSNSSSLSRLSSNVGGLGDIAGFRPQWPKVVDDAISLSSSSSSSSSGSSTASLGKSSSTVTTSRPRFTAKEKGKAPDYSWKDMDGVDGDITEHQRRHSGGEIKLKSSMKKRYRRVQDDCACDRHGVIQEDGISRDFLLLVALCIGIACAGILVVRPAVSNALGDSGGGFDLYED